MYASFIGYEEAQKLIPIFKWYHEEGELREIRGDAYKILQALKLVRDVDYSPLSGKQVVLPSERPYEFLERVRVEMRS